MCLFQKSQTIDSAKQRCQLFMIVDRPDQYNGLKKMIELTELSHALYALLFTSAGSVINQRQILIKNVTCLFQESKTIVTAYGSSQPRSI